jgi:hypothetical protein
MDTSPVYPDRGQEPGPERVQCIAGPSNPQVIVASPWCSHSISFRPWYLEPLAAGCRTISETWSPRSAIRVGGSVSKKVAIT